MLNTLLTPTAIVREALRVFHQQANFIGGINRGYDDRFAQDGAKIGDTVQIRLPNRFTVRTGAVIQVQDVAEEKVDLKITQQAGVDMNFTSKDLTLTIDDYSKRYIVPAVNQLVAHVEADALSMRKNVWNLVDGDAAAVDLIHFLNARRKLNENLVPLNDRTALMCPEHSAKLVNALKGLFNDRASVAKQYTEGMMGRTAGLDFGENTLLTAHQSGTAAKTTGYSVNGATESGSAITVQTGTATFKAGDVVTFAGCNAIHPESKADLGYLHQFTVTEDYAGGAGDLKIAPAIVVSGAKQNVSAYPTNGGAVVKVGAGANETMVESLVFQKDAFTFATADLIDVSKFGAWGARENLDGISMRIARQYDITNDQVPCRLDILYGYKAIRPEAAARVHADG